MSDADTLRRLRELERRAARLEALEGGALTGTFTPTLVGGTSGSWTVTASGFYVRVGPLVYITALITVTGASSPTGTVSIGDLPFAARNQTGERHILAVANYDFINLSAGYSALSALILPGNSSAVVRESGDNVAAQSLQAASIIVGTAFDLSGVYEAAA